MTEPHRITPARVTSLAPNETFVFGSNASGQHGQTYGIDTMSGLVVLAREVATFLDFAAAHPELTFLVTPIGTGIAGHRVEDVAPLFADAPPNVALPQALVS